MSYDALLYHRRKNVCSCKLPVVSMSTRPAQRAVDMPSDDRVGGARRRQMARQTNLGERRRKDRFRAAAATASNKGQHTGTTTSDTLTEQSSEAAHRRKQTITQETGFHKNF